VEPADPFGHEFDGLSVEEVVPWAVAAEDWGDSIPLASAAGRGEHHQLLSVATQLAASGESRRVRVGILLAGELDSPEVVEDAERLVAPFLGSDPGIKAQAILALGAFGLYSREEYRGVGGNDREYYVRWAREQALGRCAWGHKQPRDRPDPDACRALIELARDPTADTLADSAVFELGVVYGDSLGTPEVEAALTWHSTNGRPHARAYAAQALREVPQASADQFTDPPPST
jgi:hypothetical protein